MAMPWIRKHGTMAYLRPTRSMMVPATGKRDMSTSDERLTIQPISCTLNPRMSAPKSGTTILRAARTICARSCPAPAGVSVR